MNYLQITIRIACSKLTYPINMLLVTSSRENELIAFMQLCYQFLMRDQEGHAMTYRLIVDDDVTQQCLRRRFSNRKAFPRMSFYATLHSKIEDTGRIHR
jgi:hypothetical protein